MSKFKSTKRVSLAFAGDDWKEAYVNLSIPTMAEAQDIAATSQPETLAQANALAESVMQFLQAHFVSGEAPADGKLEQLSADDIPEMPLTVIAELRDQLVGEKVLSPNS